MNLIYLFLLITIILFIIPKIILIYFVPKNIRRNIDQIINFDSKNTAYSISNKSKNTIEDTFVFAPHPFTNWSLNPFYKNKSGELVHTIEGFRKTNEENSIMDTLQKNKDAYKIVCIGGSSTQCAEMDKYQDTWPGQLQRELKNRNVIVINLAVGAWNTLQSLIRCVNWLPIIKPNLLIFYHAKNDLTPLANSSIKEKFIYPDLQNVFVQYSGGLKTNFPKLFSYIPLFYLFFYIFYYRRVFNKYGIQIIYNPKPKFNIKGFERLTDQYLENIIFRQESIISMCQKIDCSVLYIPEIFKKRNDPVDEYHIHLYKKIYPKIKELITNYAHAEYHDINEDIPYESKYFIDSLHFTKEGNELISKKISQIIKDKYLSQ